MFGIDCFIRYNLNLGLPLVGPFRIEIMRSSGGPAEADDRIGGQPAKHDVRLECF